MLFNPSPCIDETNERRLVVARIRLIFVASRLPSFGNFAGAPKWMSMASLTLSIISCARGEVQVCKHKRTLLNVV